VPNHRRPPRRCSLFVEKTVVCTRPLSRPGSFKPLLTRYAEIAGRNMDTAVIKRSRRSGAMGCGGAIAFVISVICRSQDSVRDVLQLRPGRSGDEGLLSRDMNHTALFDDDIQQPEARALALKIGFTICAVRRSQSSPIYLTTSR
jgi:hypothetical protein